MGQSTSNTVSHARPVAGGGLRLWLLFGLWMAASGSMHAASGFEEIAPGVYMRPGVQATPDAENRGHVANLGFIIGRERVVVIDAGGSYAEGETVLAAVRRVTDRPIAWLVLTHMHPDHALGAAAFADRGIPIVGHAQLGDALNRRRDAYLQPVEAYLGQAAAGTRIVLPDIAVTPGQLFTLDLGGRVVELQAHPTAHTNNDLSLYDRQSGVLWLADLLFADHVPVIDGSVRGWLRLIDELGAREPALVVPGHGPVRPDWRTDLQREREYLDAVASGVRTVIAAGGDIGDALERVVPAQHAHWLMFDEFHRRNVSAAFAELEWE